MLTEKCGSCWFSQKDSNQLKCLRDDSEVDYTQPHYSPLDALSAGMLESADSEPEKYQRQLHRAMLLMTYPTTSCFRESLALLELLAEVEEKRHGKLPSWHPKCP